MIEKKEFRTGMNNVLAVIRELAFNDDVTRPELAEKMGLTTMTVSNIMKEMAAHGLIVSRETTKNTPKCGRKPVIFDFAPECPHIMAVRFARTGILCAEMDFKATILNEKSFTYSSGETPGSITSHLLSLTDAIMREASSRICAIGLASFGPIDDNGILMEPWHFFDIEMLDVKKPLTERYGIPVVISHDSNASAIAEQRYGRIRGKEDFCYIGIYTGTGCGLMLGNRIYGGVNGLTGHIGHMIMNAGEDSMDGSGPCRLEEYLSRERIVDRINEDHSFDPRLTWHDIIVLFNGETQMFRKYIEHFTHMLAVCLANIIELLDLDTIYLDYDGQESGSRIEEMLEKEVRELTRLPRTRHPVNVYKSTFGKKSILLGAFTLALDEILSGNLDADL